MIIRNLFEAQRTERSVRFGNWESVRLVLAEDGAGFSFHITTIHADTETAIWYKHHIESVYCIRGEGEIEDCTTGEKHPIQAGTVYLLDKHDKHILRATRELELACVFSPALTGDEVHDADGSYPLQLQGATTQGATTQGATSP